MAALWTAVIYYPEQFCDMVDVFQPSVDKFFEYKKSLRDYTNLLKVQAGITLTKQNYIICTEYFTKEDCIRYVVTTALHKLAIHQMSYSGLGTVAGGPMGGLSQNSDYKVDCRWSPNYIKSKIKKYHKLLSQKNIRYQTCSDYDWTSILADCNRFSEENKDYKCFIYLDPPYYEKGPEPYQFYFTEQEHEVLSKCLKEVKHPWLLSYDNVKEIRDFYSWANIKEVKINYTINKSRNNTELLISNTDLIVQKNEEIIF